MTVTSRPGNAYQENYLAFRESRAGDPEWLPELRRNAFARFEALGFPTLQHEEWRFTDVRPIAETPFARANGAPADPERALARCTYPGLTGSRLVFVDGRFSPERSDVGELPAGVTVTSLAAAIAETPELVHPWLGKLTSQEEDEAFTALNGAFLDDGLFVHVPAGTRVPRPIHATFLATAGADPVMTHPRTLFVVGANAEATIVEDYATIGEGAAFTNPVAEVFVGDDAIARHYRVARENEQTYHVATLYSEQGRNTDFTSHSALLGGALVRNNVFPALRGENGISTLNGAYLPKGKQVHDNRMRVTHAQPNCESRQHYRGILNGESRAMFTGRIIVEQIAQKTDAVQSNKNLLLSGDAIVETKPQLEIYADDVKCTHGASIGQLDEHAIFYFRSRGIDEPTARRMLTYAFVNEILDRMELEPVRERLAADFAARLDGRE